jgi:putative transposase
MTKQINQQHAKNVKNNPNIKKPIFKVSDEDPFLVKAKIVKILPSSKQMKIVNDWFSACRKIHNIGNNRIQSQGDKWLEGYILRDTYITKKNMTNKVLKSIGWTLRTPKKIREYAIIDLIAMYKAGKTKLKKKQIKKFNISSKENDGSTQSINLPHESSRIENNKLHVCGLDFTLTEKIEDMDIVTNMRLIKRNNLYYVAMPSYAKMDDIKQTKDRIVGIDPGLNIFQCYYSPDGEWGEIGIDVKDKMRQLNHKKNNLHIVNKGRVRKAIFKINSRKNNLIDDLHWKCCHFLLSNFRRIIIPRLWVSRCTKEVKELQIDMKHCYFVNRLCYKSMTYKDSEIHIVKEHYTSQACTNCRSLDTSQDKVVICNSCNFICHRDLSGARNMIIKHLC